MVCLRTVRDSRSGQRAQQDCCTVYGSNGDIPVASGGSVSKSNDRNLNAGIAPIAAPALSTSFKMPIWLRASVVSNPIELIVDGYARFNGHLRIEDASSAACGDWKAPGLGSEYRRSPSHKLLQAKFPVFNREIWQT